MIITINITRPVQYVNGRLIRTGPTHGTITVTREGVASPNKKAIDRKARLSGGSDSYGRNDDTHFWYLLKKKLNKDDAFNRHDLGRFVKRRMYTDGLDPDPDNKDQCYLRTSTVDLGKRDGWAIYDAIYVNRSAARRYNAYLPVTLILQRIERTTPRSCYIKKGDIDSAIKEARQLPRCPKCDSSRGELCTLPSGDKCKPHRERLVLQTDLNKK